MGEADMLLVVGILAGLGGLVLMLGDTPLEESLAKTPRATIATLERGQDRRLDGTLTGTPQLKGLLSGKDVLFQQVIAYQYRREMNGERELREFSRSADWTADLGVDDGTGKVLLDPTDGEFHLQRVVRLSRINMQPWPQKAPPDADVVEEWSIAPGETVMVIGNARGNGEGMVVGGKRHFVLTNSTPADLKAHHRNMRLVGGLMSAGGFAMTAFIAFDKFVG